MHVELCDEVALKTIINKANAYKREETTKSQCNLLIAPLASCKTNMLVQ